MPIVKIDVVEGKSYENKKAIVKEIFDTVQQSLGVPTEALHVRLSETCKDMYMADEDRTDDFCAVEINMWPGRSDDAKSMLIGNVVTILGDKFAIDRKNVCVIIREVEKSSLFYI